MINQSNSENFADLVVTIDGVAALVTTERSSSVPIIDTDTSSVIALWGDDNNFPNNVIKDIEEDTELGPLLEKKALLIYSGGLKWGKRVTENGKSMLQPLDDKTDAKVRDFMQKSNISRYLLEASTDLVTFYNAFVEIVLSRDKKQIVQICSQEAAYTRLEKMKAGAIQNAYLSANWPEVKISDAKKLPVIDPYYASADFLKKKTSKGGGNNYIYILSIPTAGKTYYQLARWNGIRKSGWLDVAKLVPKSKKYLLQGQLNIKYHIEIHEMYWPTKFPEWNSWSPEEKQEKVKSELESFKKILSGVEKTGNSLITAMKSDPNFQNTMSMWKINVIDDKLKNGQFLEEGKDSSRHKMAAIGLHPALVGTFENNGMGGAGSNIREAYNLNNFTNRPFQDILLEPLYLVAEYNGWGKDIVFEFENPYMTTLDKGVEVKTPV